MVTTFLPFFFGVLHGVAERALGAILLLRPGVLLLPLVRVADRGLVVRLGVLLLLRLGVADRGLIGEFVELGL